MESKKNKEKTKQENKKLASNKVKDNPKNINPQKPIKKDISSKHQNKSNQNIIKTKQNLEEKELKIDLFPKNVPKGKLEKKIPIFNSHEDNLYYSLNKKRKIAFPLSNVPLLNGFYTAHCQHYPIRLKPDDIWLLIIQAFSNHVNANSEQLRKYFVNFDDKETLIVNYQKESIKDLDNETLEDFSVQINEQLKKFLGEEIVQILTSDFSTTNYDSLIISKLSIMGAFKKYFNYEMIIGICGIPYIILEGTADDYQKIKVKSEKLSKYEFDWYINRIIPHIQKMIEAKMGKIDNDYFRDIIKRNEVKDNIIFDCIPEDVMVSNITGWILDFFAYEKTKDDKLIKFNDKSLKFKDFNRLACQMLTVPFVIKDRKSKYKMNYNVGFIGCDQNEKKEVFPVQAWVVSSSTPKNLGGDEFKDPIPPKFLDDRNKIEEQNAKELDELLNSLKMKEQTPP